MWLNFWMVSFEVHALVFNRIQVLGYMAFEDKGTMLCRNIGSHSPEDSISYLRRPHKVYCIFCFIISKAEVLSKHCICNSNF